jgi:hypothetical protein
MLHISGVLDGGIRVQLDEAERFVWIGLLLLAGRSRTRGVIQASKGIGFPRETIAMAIGTSVERLEATIEKCKRDHNDPAIHGNELPRLIEDENGCLHITNWDKYQHVPTHKQKNHETPTERRHREIANLMLYTKRYPNYAAKMLADKGWETRNGKVYDSRTGELVTDLDEVK